MYVGPQIDWTPLHGCGHAPRTSEINYRVGNGTETETKSYCKTE